MARPSPGATFPALGLALLAACSPPEPEAEEFLPAATPLAIVAAAADCAAAVSTKRANLILLRERGWREARQGSQAENFMMPYVALVKSGEAPLMTIAESEDGSRTCSLTSRMSDGTRFEDVRAAFDTQFGNGKDAEGFYYYYQEPDLLVLAPHPRAPESQVQVAVLEPGVEVLIKAGVLLKDKPSASAPAPADDAQEREQS